MFSGDWFSPDNPQHCEASGLSGVLSICRNKNNNGRIGGRHWQSKLNGNLILLKCSNWLGLSVQHSSIIFQLTGQPRSQTKSEQILLLGFEFFPPGSWFFFLYFFFHWRLRHVLVFRCWPTCQPKAARSSSSSLSLSCWKYN